MNNFSVTSSVQPPLPLPETQLFLSIRENTTVRRFGVPPPRLMRGESALRVPPGTRRGTVRMSTKRPVQIR